MQSFIERVESAITDLQAKKPVILTDHPDRENEGDLIYPAEIITAEWMNFIIRNTSGIVCLSILESQMKQLNLSYMISPYENSSMRGTPFTISIDAKEGITTGVSASDRVATVLAAIHENAIPEDLVKPGHIFPLCAKPNGVLERPGHTEGAMDLIHLAGFKPGAVLCEIMNADGTMASGEKLNAFAKAHHLTILSIDDIIAYRLCKENLITDEVNTEVLLEDYGHFTLSAIREKLSSNEHIVLENIKKSSQEIVVRIHSSCFTGDVLGSKRCDCHAQLHYSLQRISQEGGVLIYLNQEGRGIGLFNKMKAYALQDQGYDTIEANQLLGLPVDGRQYAIAANILRNRSIDAVRLLTNNPMKIADLKKYGIREVRAESLPSFCHAHNKKYLQTKKIKLNHSINDDLLKIII
jgi:3,4-dihydroxy 2-butanone 4-phosphate synthase / GTP cyclohydrolase II